MNPTQRRARVTLFILMALSPLTPLCADDAPSTAPAAVHTQPAQPARPTLQALQSQYAPLLTGLASADFESRDAAQKKLDAVTWRSLEDLRQLAAAAFDAEVKARLELRIEALEDQLAVSPPPISLDVKDAPLGKITAALRAQGVNIAAGRGDFAGGSYTLSAKDTTFVDLVRQLNSQHPLAFANEGESLACVASPGNAMTVFSQALITHQWSSLMNGAAAGNGNAYLVSLGVLIDPRVQIAACVAHIEKSADEFGKPLQIHDVQTNDCPTNFWGHCFSIELPAGSQKLALIKGEFTVTVAVRQETIELDHPEKHLNEPLKLGKGSITLEKFEASTDRVAYSAGMGPSSSEIDAQIASGVVRSRAELIVTGKIIDASGRTLETVSPSSGGSTSGAHVATLPVKLVLTVPIRTTEVKIPFELHNVPLN